jgi:hypothetical protein
MAGRHSVKLITSRLGLWMVSEGAPHGQNVMVPVNGIV